MQVWQQRGTPLRIPAAGTDQRLTLFGALDYQSGELVTRQTRAAAAAATFASFLDQLVARWPTEHLVVVLDNASYHKTAALRAWFADHRDQLTVFWLPTYTPHLNLIERVWRFLKQQLACHRFWQDLDGLARAAHTLCEAIRAQFTAPTYPHITLRHDFCLSA